MAECSVVLLFGPVLELVWFSVENVQLYCCLVLFWS